MKAVPLPDVPPPGQNLQSSSSSFQSIFGVQVTRDCVQQVNSFGVPFSRIDNVVLPSICKPEAVNRLMSEFDARASDVFTVFSTPLLEELLSLTVALVEQRSAETVDLEFPRWLEAAVSRRGWQFIDAIENWNGRRCFRTNSPPSLFPCRNVRLPGKRERLVRSWADEVDDENASGVEVPPRIVVFVSDPRYLIMKDFFAMKEMSQQDVQLSQFLDLLAESDEIGLVQSTCAGGCLKTLLAWAEAEALSPDHIRLFFLEDFALQPEVAMRGLVSFLSADTISDATEVAIRTAGRIFSSMSEERPTSLSRKVGSINAHIDLFENLIEGVGYGAQATWEISVKRWLASPNPRMVTMANWVLQRAAWSPPKWWAAHSARLCRPCLFFPRGKCHDDDCDYCHGEGHHKPKRANHQRRKRRNHAYRSPSPQRQLHDYDDLSAGESLPSKSSTTTAGESMTGTPRLAPELGFTPSREGLPPFELSANRTQPGFPTCC